MGLLDIDVIQKELCDITQQQGTTFNRIFVCKIIHYLDDKGFYKEPYNANAMTRALEGDDTHSIRTHGLNWYPDEDVCNRIDNYFENLNLQLWISKTAILGQSNTFNEANLGENGHYINKVDVLNIDNHGQQSISREDSDSTSTSTLNGVYQHFITHDAVGVPELIRKARHHIVLYAAFYTKYGFDNQGDDVSKAMEKNPNLRLTAIFTDVNAPWVDEFAFTLCDYYAEKGEFFKHLDVTKQHFVRLRKKFG